ncbi:phenoloxidase 1 [Diachasma alloeum]|uniref:phenoloxidase 1 n=1 Tax=Diachasma alloeum TaxID=454923 RepID=UPI00073834D2|nr:phenoloxidase 1 [Diachasma alloeum]
MAGSNRDILYLFDRPAEPVFVPKGDSEVVFDIPANYLIDRYRPVAGSIFNRFNDATESKIPVKEISIPDLRIPLQLGRREPFSLFIPAHRKMAGRLIDIFLGMRTYEDFLSVSLYCRDRINPNMFIYALSVAILHRPDTKNLPIPSLHEVFPDKYMDGGIFSRAKEEANVVPAGSRIPIEIPLDYTASDLDEEHRVAYWREDVGINLHHWHWHLVYPFDGDRSIVNKDRRGELFYYMHQQIMARYNTERLCNHLPRVKRLNNLHDPIPEAYFPKLDSLVSSRTWPSRPAGAKLYDINRTVDQVRFDLEGMVRWRDRIYEAIHTGSFMNAQGERVQLTEKGGIDVLGNMVEASILTPNDNLYGDLHNLGHVAIAYCHDPDHRYLESFGVMGDSATAMRDPVFYRWHAFINDIFLEHKTTLPAYERNQLEYPGIEISGLQVATPNQTPNILMTFWNKSDIDLSRGLDFTPRGPVLARFTHLNHAGFTYTINVNNRGNNNQMGTVRIFVGPKNDERNVPLNIRDQQQLMIELDKFTVTLRPGQNTITRNSKDSSVTIPFERTFRNLDSNRPTGGDSLEQFNLCGCGWPQHMLVPKGNVQGFPMYLFVMVSDFAGDVVEQAQPVGCSDAGSYCGIRDRKYPDARAMGYPFDRRPRAGVESLQQFLTPNMAVIEISVRFTDSVLPRTRSGSVENALTFA